MSSQIEIQHFQGVGLEPFPMINNNPAAKKSTRKKELERAKVRAHAATVGHRRRDIQRPLSLFSTSVSGLSHRSVSPRLSQCSPSDSLGRSLHSSTEDADGAEAMDSTGIVGQLYHGKEPSFRTLCRRRDSASLPRFGPLTTRSRFDKTPRVVAPPSPRPGFGSFRGELFSAVPNGEDIKVKTCVEFFTNYMNPTNDLVTEMFDVTNAYSTYVNFLNCPLFHDAGLCVVGATRGQLIQTDAAFSTLTLESKCRSLRKVRLHLQRHDWQNPDRREGLITAVIFLALVEAIQGHLDVALQHMNGLKRTIDALGGLQTLPIRDKYQERTNVLFFESSFAIIRGGSLFAEDRRPWQPYYPWPPFTGQLQILFEGLPVGFQRLLLERKLSFDTIIVLQRAVKLRIGHNTASQQEARAQRRTSQRMYPDFIEACPVLLVPETEAIMPEKLLCLALIIYCFISFDTVRLQLSIFRSSKMQLSRALRTFQPCTEAEQKLTVWIFMVAIDCYRTGAGNAKLADEGIALLKSFRCTFADATVNGWEGVQTVLDDFFWTPGLAKFWKQSWDSLTGNI